MECDLVYDVCSRRVKLCMSRDECSVLVCVWQCVALLETPDVCVVLVLVGTCRRAG